MHKVGEKRTAKLSSFLLPFCVWIFALMKIVYSLLIIVLYSCSQTAAEKRVQNGKQLARVYCSTCHAFPDPNLLDKKSWFSGVLPKMGSLMGFRQFESATYFEDDYVRRSIALADWNDIVRYYVSAAPRLNETTYGYSPNRHHAAPVPNDSSKF